MPIATCSCHCGSVDQLIRGFLQSTGYEGWATIPIEKGKNRSLAMLDYLPQFPELDMLRSFLKDASKWAVVVGYNENGCRWSDIAHNGPKSRIEAELVVQNFA